MDFTLSQEQAMLRELARDFLKKKCPENLVREMEGDEKGYSLEIWREMAELGWIGLILPEEYLGANMRFIDLAILLEEMGRACLPGPFFSTIILGALPVKTIGSETLQAELLPAIARGETILTFALTEASARYTADAIQTTANPEGDNFIISGSKMFVPDAHIADYLICAARTDESAPAEHGITLFLVDMKTQGVRSKGLKTIAGDKLFEVNFDNVCVPKRYILGAVNAGWFEARDIIERATVGKCCEAVGGLQEVLDMTVSYAKERNQFGRPIGSFQIIQHYCAEMAIAVAGARFVTYQAAWLISEELPCRKEIAIAKAWVGDISRRVTALAHQIHGAIGFTMEHDLQLYTRRLKAFESTFGDASFYREIIAQESGY